MEHSPDRAVETNVPTDPPETADVQAPESEDRDNAADMALEDGYGSGDSESTPRSEVPSITDNHTFPQSSQVAEDQGYFAPRPLPYHPTANKSTGSIGFHPVQSQSVPPPSLLAESVAAGARGITRPSSTSFDHHGRPTVQRDLSSTSTASTATVTAAPSDPTSFPPSIARRPQQDYPQFPNQAYAALQSQLHPSPYPPPPPFRARSAHPSDYTSLSAAATPLHHPQARLITESGSKTAGNSPSGSPGLFTPTASPIRPNVSQFEEDGYYATPYLHFTHRQAPKETHVADVDVDPISGRKIINEYEILDELGRGAHGKVKLGRSLTTSTFVAIKIVERYAKKRRLGKLGNAEDKVKKEVAILKKARHPNIVALLEVIDDPARKKVYIVLEWVQRGEITWRARCPKALALLEARRYERESAGMFNDKDAEEEDEAIWGISEKRRLKHERSQLRKSRRSGLANFSNDSWSFEYGGEYDDDDWDLASQHSSVASENAASRARKASREASVSDILKTVTQVSVDEQSRAGTVVENSDSTVTEKSIAKRPADISTSTGLEGTMYGAYTTESPSHWYREGRLNVSETEDISRFEDTGNVKKKSSPEELLDADMHDDLIYVPYLSFQAARVAFRDTVLGIEYLHYQGIIHRDIKPPNLLQTVDHHIKISDFGVSYLGRPIHDDPTEDSETDAQEVKFDEARELAKTVGTAAFYAPELCHTDPDCESPPVTGQIDVWALGVTLFCLIFARTPFVDNEFVIMKNIAEKEVYVPTKRLRPLQHEASSRPPSQGRLTPFPNSRRHEHERFFEVLDEDLYDLLKRLFIKDPSQRITLTEVKHHPWVLRDIADPIAWLDETDPSRQSEGKKIEITREEMNEAVVPLNIIERMRSGIRKLGGALGLGSGGKTGTTSSRKRAKSSAPNPEPGISSTTSSSSTLSQEARRPSLRGDELAFSSFRVPREGEHPLSQSLTASPEIKEGGLPPFASSPDRSTSPAGTITKKDSNTSHPDASRTEQQSRTQSPFAKTSSVRTVRRADLAKMIIPRTGSTTPPLTSATLPTTPHSLEAFGSTGLSGLFGGASRRFLKRSRSRERSPGSGSGSSRAPSGERGADDYDDPHGAPSVALSNDIAAGRLDPPELLKKSSTGSLSTSPSASRAQSLVQSGNSTGTHHSKSGSYSIGYSRERPTFLGPNRRPSQDLNLQLARSGSISIDQNASADARFYRAQDELVRRRQLEASQLRERPPSSQHRTTGITSNDVCPNSPDDEMFYNRRQPEEEALRLQTTQRVPSLETSPTSSTTHFHHPDMTPSSSEDQLTSAMSQSTSNPSIPSVASANSSIVPDDGYGFLGQQKASPVPHFAAPVPIRPLQKDPEYDDGYAGDHAQESNDDDDDSDSDEDDGFLEMSRKKMASEGVSPRESLVDALLFRRHRSRREASAPLRSRLSDRNWSDGTLKLK